MKSLYKIAGLLTLCVIASCRKDQLDQTSSTAISTSTPIEQKSTVHSSEITPASWTAVNQPSHSVFHTQIDANNLNADVDKSVIRIARIDPSGTASTKELPFEETRGSQKSYWYYEVMDGSIMVSVDVYGSRDNPAAKSSFKYVALDNKAVQTMEAKGFTRNSLMKMSYDNLDKLN